MAVVTRERHWSDVTKRELDVLRLAAVGMTNDAIGRELWLSQSSVKFHMTHLLRKLGARNRVQLALEARRRGLVKAETSPEMMPLIEAAARTLDLCRRALAETEELYARLVDAA